MFREHLISQVSLFDHFLSPSPSHSLSLYISHDYRTINNCIFSHLFRKFIRKIVRLHFGPPLNDFRNGRAPFFLVDCFHNDGPHRSHCPVSSVHYWALHTPANQLCTHSTAGRTIIPYNNGKENLPLSNALMYAPTHKHTCTRYTLHAPFSCLTGQLCTVIQHSKWGGEAKLPNNNNSSQSGSSAYSLSFCFVKHEADSSRFKPMFSSLFAGLILISSCYCSHCPQHCTMDVCCCGFRALLCAILNSCWSAADWISGFAAPTLARIELAPPEPIK